MNKHNIYLMLNYLIIKQTIRFIFSNLVLLKKYIYDLIIILLYITDINNINICKQRNDSI